jgi:chromosome segregation ATPase
MSDMKKALEAIRREGVRLEGLRAAAEALEKIASLDDLCKELDGRRSIAEAKCVEAVAKLDLAQKALSEAEAQADLVSKIGQTTADKMLQKAKEDADFLIAETKVMVTKMISEANKNELALAGSISEKRATISVLDKEIKELDGTLKLLLAEKKALLAKLG